MATKPQEEGTEMAPIDFSELQSGVDIAKKRVQEVAAIVSAFKKKSKKICIKDMDDKAGYESTKKFLGEVRPTRTTLVAEKKETLQMIRKLGEIVGGAYDGPIEDCIQIEAPHKTRKIEYEEYWEKEKQRKAEAAEKRINGMIHSLTLVGFVYEPGSGYFQQQGVENPMSFNRANIEKMEDEAFAPILEKATEQYNIRLAAAEEEKRKAQVVLDRKNQIMKFGANISGDTFTMLDLATQTPLSLTISEDVADLNEEEFTARFVSPFETLKIANGAILAGIAAQTAENKRIADENAATLKKLAEQAEKQNRQKLELVGKELQLLGAKFTYGATLDEGNYTFTNTFGTVSATGKQLLEDDGELLESLKTQIQALKEQQTQKEADDKARADKAEQEAADKAAEAKLKAEQQAAADAEKARKLAEKNREAAKPEMDHATTHLLGVKDSIKLLTDYGYKYINAEVVALANMIAMAIVNFEEKTKHFKEVQEVG